ncbi:MAG: IS66 family insertion sequence element accessory protein TnpB [Sandaracinaceae bacterium]|nr:IS66 family insertion sequence element accessory protein TnpB [Sandaracinaceae bacterium]
MFVALDPVSLHKSFDTLAGEVQELMGRSPRTGGLFIFFNRRRTALKAIFADVSGLCIFYKRLDRGRFLLPSPWMTPRGGARGRPAGGVAGRHRPAPRACPGEEDDHAPGSLREIARRPEESRIEL